MPTENNFNPELFQYDPAETYEWHVFPKVTLAIVTWNRLEYTKKLINSLINYTHLPHEFLIIDNASTDGTAAFLEAFAASGDHTVRLILNTQNLGLSRAHLQIRDAISDGLIVVFDNDVELLSNYWLLHVQKAYHALRQVSDIDHTALGIRLVNCEEYGFRYAEKQEIYTIPHAKNAEPRSSFAATGKDDSGGGRQMDEQIVIGWTQHLLGGVFAVPAALWSQIPMQEQYPAFIGGVDAFFSRHAQSLGGRLGYIENGPIARHNDWPYTKEKIAAYETMVKQRATLDSNYVRWKARDVLRRLLRK